MTLDENSAQQLAAFMHSHPTTMVIHLQEKDSQYEVSYANKKASTYFNRHVGIAAPSFFGDLWSNIELALQNTYIHDHHHHILNLSFISGEAVEMEIQCTEVH